MFSGWIMWAHGNKWYLHTVPFEISGNPHEIKVELLTSYNLTCRVQVDSEFLLEGVRVWMRFHSEPTEDYDDNYHVNLQERTISYSHNIPYITEKHLGTYECVAETISNLASTHGMIPSYISYKQIVLVRTTPQSSSSGKLIVLCEVF